MNVVTGEPTLEGSVSKALDELYLTIVPRDKANMRLLESILKSAGADGQSVETNQKDTDFGEVEHPVDYAKLVRLKYTNIQHGRCIDAKVTALVGFGYKRAKEISEKLDDLCKKTFAELSTEIAYDVVDTGAGYMEVVRDESDTLVGLNFMSVTKPKVERTKDGWHWKIHEPCGTSQNMAFFGDKEDYKKRNTTDTRTKAEISELIQIRVPQNLSPEYGIPSHLAVIPKIEMSSVINQFNYDFFQNWGAVAQMLILHGAAIDPKTWAAIKTEYVRTVKEGHGMKGVLAHIPGKDLKIDKVDLGSNQFEGHFLEYERQVAVDIVGGHGVPHPIAMIQPNTSLTFPKTDETKDSVKMFQGFWAGAMQMLWANTLEGTLGQEIKLAPVKEQRQVTNGVSQEFEEIEHSGWMPKTIEESLQFGMAPQAGGPDDGKGLGQSQGAPKAGSTGTNGVQPS